MPSRPAIASRWITALVEPPIAARATIALWKDPRVKTWLGRRSAVTISTASRPAACEPSSSRLSGRRRCRRSRGSSPLVPRPRAPSSRPCPSCCSGPCCGSSTTPTSGTPPPTGCRPAPPRLRRHTSVPQPSGTPRKVPVSIGPPGTTSAGMSTDAAAISSDGIVLSQPPSSTTPSIGLARMLSSTSIAREVAIQHRGRPHLGLPQGHHRQVERDAAGLVDALLHARGHLVEVRVAGREVRCRVGDRDVRAPVECVRRQPAAHPGPMDVGVAIGAVVPLAAARDRCSSSFTLLETAVRAFQYLESSCR